MKEVTKNIKYHMDPGETSACMKIMMEATKGLCQREIQGNTKDIFIFGHWIDSNRLAEAAVDVGDYMVGMVKTNKKGFCKETIENMTKY